MAEVTAADDVEYVSINCGGCGQYMDCDVTDGSRLIVYCETPCDAAWEIVVKDGHQHHRLIRGKSYRAWRARRR